MYKFQKSILNEIFIRDFAAYFAENNLLKTNKQIFLSQVFWFKLEVWRHLWHEQTKMYDLATSRTASSGGHRRASHKLRLILVLILPLLVSLNSGLKTSYSKSYTGYSHDEAAGTLTPNITSQTWAGNPREYTIGGVLSGLADIEHYFRQVLSVSLSD